MNSSQVWKRGRARTLRKPSCDWAMLTFPRSHSGLTGRPRLRSWSPCRKNSLVIWEVHILWMDNFLALWPISAHLRHISIAISLCLSFDMLNPSSEFNIYLNSASLSKCFYKSVAKIIATILCLRVVHSSFSKFSTMLVWGDFKRSKVTLQCMFSSTLWSLYFKLSSC